MNHKKGKASLLKSYDLGRSNHEQIPHAFRHSEFCPPKIWAMIIFQGIYFAQQVK